MAELLRLIETWLGPKTKQNKRQTELPLVSNPSPSISGGAYPETRALVSHDQDLYDQPL